MPLPAATTQHAEDPALKPQNDHAAGPEQAVPAAVSRAQLSEQSWMLHRAHIVQKVVKEVESILRDKMHPVPESLSRHLHV